MVLIEFSGCDELGVVGCVGKYGARSAGVHGADDAITFHALYQAGGMVVADAKMALYERDRSAAAIDDQILGLVIGGIRRNVVGS